MSAGRAGRLGRGAVAALVAGMALIGCGGGGGGGSDEAVRPSWCAALSLADRVLERGDRSFRELVATREWDDNHLGAAAVLALVGTDDGGAFRPLLEHLVERHAAALAGTDPPAPSGEVRELASRADRELGEGACG